MEKWSLEFTKAAERDFTRLNKVIQLRVLHKVEWLQDNFESTFPTQLHGEFKGLYRLRIGEWRVVYSVERDARLIVIHLIGKRDKIYKDR